MAGYSILPFNGVAPIISSVFEVTKLVPCFFLIVSELISTRRRSNSISDRW